MVINPAETEIIITGANGLVGFEMLKESQRSWPGFVIKALVRQKPKVILQGVEYVYGDLTKEIPLTLFTKPKAIILHFASLLKASTLTDYEKVNVEGTKRLLEAAGTRVAMVIYGSSTSVYGQGPFKNVAESSPSQPETDLAISRFKAEQFILTFTDKNASACLILRPRFLFGNRDRETLPGLLKLSKSPLKLGNGKQKLSFIEVEDYAIIVSHLIKNFYGTGRGEILNISYNDPMTLDEMLGILNPAQKRIKFRLPVKLLISLGPKKIKTKLQLFGQDQVLSTQKLMELFPLLKDMNGKDKFNHIATCYSGETRET